MPLLKNHRLCLCRNSLLRPRQNPLGRQRFAGNSSPHPILPGRKRGTNCCGFGIPSGRGRKPRSYTSTMLLPTM
ncbi:hypothetical protein NDU88_007026 [Pleurodeles waltl]|uniref:Uncharacterized protein n=1 Tax=Pleurodeles waltl TaxID=8319 RepID=A0AAV7RNX4_PLEWA|nr:hypothetical protein NDU88_007026 [Pleurodeles waltl]